MLPNIVKKAVLFLLVGDIVALLLWQQLQLKEKNTKNKVQQPNKLLIITGFIILIIFCGWLVFYKIQPKVNKGQRGVEFVSKLSEVQEFKKAVEENGRSTFNVVVAAELTKDNPYYLIQVFETLADHRTTFRWYRYYPDTGKIFTQFLERATTDNWEEVE